MITVGGKNPRMAALTVSNSGSVTLLDSCQLRGQGLKLPPSKKMSP